MSVHRCMYASSEKRVLSFLTFIFREVMKDGEERWGEALGYWDAIWREVGLLNPPGDFSLDLPKHYRCISHSVVSDSLRPHGL